MANETKLACVSCETPFEPEPNGGFCPDCDTPHPDYDRTDVVDEQATEEEPPTDGDAEEIESPETDEEGEAAAVETEDADEEGEAADDDSETADEDAESDEVTPVGEDESEVVDELESETPVGESESDSETPVGEDESETPVGGGESETGDASEDEQTETADGDDEPVEAAEIDAAETEEVEDAAKSDDVEAEGEAVEAAEDEPAETDADEADDGECRSCGSAVAASASFCPNCGTEVGVTEAESESTSLEACPDCENPVTDESFCPNCGTDLDAAREGAEPADESAEDESQADVTLVVGDGTYTLSDGDTFGRQDEPWLSDLVTASGGRDEASYVSGDHLRFDVEDDGVYVTDLGRNGTIVDDEELDGGRRKLEGGETLTLAERAEIGVRL